MHFTTPDTNNDSRFGNITSNDTSLQYYHQESYLYSTTSSTHTDSQYCDTTSIKSLTYTPLPHLPTLTLSMVTPPVPRV